MQTLKDEILDIIAANVILSQGEDTGAYMIVQEHEAAEDILRAIQRHYPQVVFDPPLSPG